MVRQNEDRYKMKERLYTKIYTQFFHVIKCLINVQQFICFIFFIIIVVVVVVFLFFIYFLFNFYLCICLWIWILNRRKKTIVLFVWFHVNNFAISCFKNQKDRHYHLYILIYYPHDGKIQWREEWVSIFSIDWALWSYTMAWYAWCQFQSQKSFVQITERWWSIPSSA